jgi:hypothetical protein
VVSAVVQIACAILRVALAESLALSARQRVRWLYVLLAFCVRATRIGCGLALALICCLFCLHRTLARARLHCLRFALCVCGACLAFVLRLRAQRGAQELPDMAFPALPHAAARAEHFSAFNLCSPNLRLLTSI